MTTEAKKPRSASTRIREIALAEAESTQEGRNRLLATWGHPEINLVTIERYLDEEADRRQQWERGVEERLGKVARPICPLCLEPIARGQGHNVGANGVPMHNNCPE